MNKIIPIDLSELDFTVWGESLFATFQLQIVSKFDLTSFYYVRINRVCIFSRPVSYFAPEQGFVLAEWILPLVPVREKFRPVTVDVAANLSIDHSGLQD